MSQINSQGHCLRDLLLRHKMQRLTFKSGIRACHLLKRRSPARVRVLRISLTQQPVLRATLSHANRVARRFAALTVDCIYDEVGELQRLVMRQSRDPRIASHLRSREHARIDIRARYINTSYKSKVCYTLLTSARRQLRSFRENRI